VGLGGFRGSETWEVWLWKVYAATLQSKRAQFVNLHCEVSLGVVHG